MGVGMHISHLATSYTVSNLAG